LFSRDRQDYDDGDRVTGVTSTIAGLSTAIGDVVFAQEHDLAGRRVRQTAEIGSTPTHDFQNDYQYDQMGRLKLLTQRDQPSDTYNPVAEKRVDFTYNLASQFDTIDRFNTLAGASTDRIALSTYGYDGAGRLTSLAPAPIRVDVFFQGPVYQCAQSVRRRWQSCPAVRAGPTKEQRRGADINVACVCTLTANIGRHGQTGLCGPTMTIADGHHRERRTGLPIARFDLVSALESFRQQLATFTVSSGPRPMRYVRSMSRSWKRSPVTRSATGPIAMSHTPPITAPKEHPLSAVPRHEAKPRLARIS
jgi:hypothetical protein